MLIGLHVYTGCDSTSAFHGSSKKRVLDLMKNSAAFIRTSTELGKDFTLSSSLVQGLETFACALYGHVTLRDLNEAWYTSFCVSSSLERRLPPTKDAHYQHVLRCAYQASIHRRSLERRVTAPSPEGHGWVVKDDDLHVKWMDQSPAPRCHIGRCPLQMC